MLIWTLAAVILVGPATDCLPATLSTERVDREGFIREAYCKDLAEAGEALFTSEPGYRFTWAPSFDPTRIVVVRMEAGRPIVIGKILRAAKGSYTADDLGKSTKRSLTVDEWRLLNQRMENAGLWEPQDTQPRLITDGSLWIVEARHGGKYQFRTERSPGANSSPQFRKACEYLLTLAGIHPGSDRVY